MAFFTRNRRGFKHPHRTHRCSAFAFCMWLFIKPDDSGEDIFVHSTGLVDHIRENDKVTFELERGLKGMNAVRVKKV